MKNSEMLKLLPNHLTTKKMVKHEVKKFSFVIRLTPDRYKTQKMCDKAFLENDWMLEFFPDCYKNQKMCDEPVDNYPYTFKNLSLIARWIKKCVINLSMLIILYWNLLYKCVVKLLIDVFLKFIYVHDPYKTQEMCDSVVSGDPFMLVYYLNKYKTQRMCDENVDDCLTVLKFILDWFATSEMLEKSENTL